MNNSMSGIGPVAERQVSVVLIKVSSVNEEQRHERVGTSRLRSPAAYAVPAQAGIDIGRRNIQKFVLRAGVVMASIASIDDMPPHRRQHRSSFHFVLALIIATLVFIGFGSEAIEFFINSTLHYPLVLHFHAAAASAWLLLYVVQTGLVRYGHTRWHRKLGVAGAAIAGAMIPLGFITAFTMRHFDIVSKPGHVPLAGRIAFVAIPLKGIICFTALVIPALLLRKHRAVHSRLMFLTIATIADAGYSRLPIQLPGLPDWLMYASYAAAIGWDYYAIGRVAKAYWIAVPLLIAINIFAEYLAFGHPAWWVALVRPLVGV